MTTTIMHDGFHVDVSERSPGLNLPQRIGRVLWLPMLLMALVAFPLGAILGAIRGSEIASGGELRQVAALGQFAIAANFVGFAAVLAAVAFAVARILGEFRDGGGRVQEAAGAAVETPVMPRTARAFILLMALGMMALLVAAIGHASLGSSILGERVTPTAVERWNFWLESLRRAGVATYLFAIAFGLATIVTIVRFQTLRIGQLFSGQNAGH